MNCCHVFPHDKLQCRLQKLSEAPQTAETIRMFNNVLPTRLEHQKAMMETEYDVLVIGGGATGTGVALDAVTRGRNFHCYSNITRKQRKENENL